MRRTDAIAWVVSVCSCLRLSQAKTLAILVAAAMRVERASLANLGRAMLGNAKHQIKRAWRFCANDRVETADAMRGVIARLLRRRKKTLLVSLDWTDIRGFTTLVAAAVIKGRGVPLCWASCTNSTFAGHRSRNSFEEALLLVLRSMIPRRVKVIILADRGFGRTELARFCQRSDVGFHYLIRISPDVRVKLRGFEGNLRDYPVHKGIGKLLGEVRYKSHHSVTQNLVLRWKKGLPPDRDECWYLMTDLQQTAVRLSDLYARRMCVEELFRDAKSKRNGWSLRDTRISKPQRLDRLILILAIAYLLLTGLGLRAATCCRPSAWCSNARADTCSAFQIGLIMLDKLKCSPPQAFAAILTASEEVIPKWG
jgi:hypothetical protein